MGKASTFKQVIGNYKHNDMNIGNNKSNNKYIVYRALRQCYTVQLSLISRTKRNSFYITTLYIARYL